MEYFDRTQPIDALRSTRVLHQGGIRPATIHLSAGRIDRVTDHSAISDGNVLDVGDLVVFPGLIDPHVHLNDPGRSEWEGFMTGTAAAACGGITTLFDMPLNSTPVTVDRAGYHAKSAAAESLHVHVGFHGGLISDNESSVMELYTLGVRTVKVFLVHSGLDEFPNITIDALHKIAPVLSNLGMTLLVHAELEEGRSDEQRSLGHCTKTLKEWEKSRPPAMEVKAIAAVIDICRQYNLRTHIVHVAAAEALPLIATAKAEGLPITAETCTQYLNFTSDHEEQGDARLKCAPPLRDELNRRALLAALKDGTLDLVATDHSPATPEMKLAPCAFEAAWGGVNSLQYLLPATWTAVQATGIDMPRLGELLSTNAAKLLRIDDIKGRISAARDADFVVWDPEVEWTPDEQGDRHRHRMSPYLGRTLKGRVMITILEGNVIYHDGDLINLVLGEVLVP